MMGSTQHDNENEHLGRSVVVRGGAMGAVPLFAAGSAHKTSAEESASKLVATVGNSFPGVISRQRDPNNLEFPFPTLSSFLTPNEQFYVRTHFEVPELDADTWRLKVEGAIERSFEISFDELRKMPSQKVTALLECSGNSRVFLKPPQVSIRWEQGAVSNAEWTGVPLSVVLERAGLKENAVEVVLEGADKGKFESPEPTTPGEITYARSLTLAKAKRPEVLLAYQMNGKELPAEHGYPVRVVVPGWYGMASVKWLKRILVTERPFHGFFQSFMYSIWQRHAGLPDLVPVTEIEVKAQIARPTLNEVILADAVYRIHGAAWTGEGHVAKVEVSTDGGKSWSEARLLDKSICYSWRFWEFEWATPAKAGHHTLMAQATDDSGRVQPMHRDEDRRDAVISHVQPIKVEIRQAS